MERATESVSLLSPSVFVLSNESGNQVSKKSAIRLKKERRPANWLENFQLQNPTSALPQSPGAELPIKGPIVIEPEDPFFISLNWTIGSCQLVYKMFSIHGEELYNSAEGEESLIFTKISKTSKTSVLQISLDAVPKDGSIVISFEKEQMTQLSSVEISAFSQLRVNSEPKYFFRSQVTGIAPSYIHGKLERINGKWIYAPIHTSPKHSLNRILNRCNQPSIHQDNIKFTHYDFELLNFSPSEYTIDHYSFDRWHNPTKQFTVNHMEAHHDNIIVLTWNIDPQPCEYTIGIAGSDNSYQIQCNEVSRRVLLFRTSKYKSETESGCVPSILGHSTIIFYNTRLDESEETLISIQRRLNLIPVTYLRFTVERGIDLSPKDINGFSDPYVVAIAGNLQLKSNIVNKTLNPLWMFNVDIAVEHFDKLELKVFDYDLLSSDDYIGSVTITKQLPIPFSRYFVLWDEVKSEYGGAILVKMDVRP